MKDSRPIDFKLRGVRLTPDDVRLLMKRGERRVYSNVNYTIRSDRKLTNDSNRCLRFWDNHFYTPLCELDIEAIEQGTIYTISQYDYDRLMDYKRSLES